MSAQKDPFARAREIPLLISEKATELKADLWLPSPAKSLIIFCLGPLYKSSSLPYDIFAKQFVHRFHGTLLVDLLEEWELRIGGKAQNTDLLADRLLLIFHWLKNLKLTKDLPFALFASGKGVFPSVLASSLSKVPIHSLVCTLELEEKESETYEVPFNEKCSVPSLLLLERNAPKYLDDLMNHFTGPKDLVFLRENFQEERFIQRASQLSVEWFENTCWLKSA